MPHFLRKIIPWPIVSLYHFLWAFGSALWFLFPSRKLTVIGVTGTKGKTTVTELVGYILERTGAKVAIASGLHFKIGEWELPNLLKMTMPGRGFLQWFLGQAVRAGCKYAVIEVTSEGIKQHRHRFIKFDVCALTNLRPEHLEAHGSFEAYRAAKGGLFWRTKRGTHVINLEEKDSEYFLKIPAKQKVGYGLLKETCPVFGDEVTHCLVPDVYRIDPQGMQLTVERQHFLPKLRGHFNAYNILCAMGIAKALGISFANVFQAVEEFDGVPGRMEFVSVGQPFRVMVDYAHTPDSLEALYQTVRDFSETRGNLICVLGAAGGGRDKWKRPVLGEIASKYCDMIFLTSEDPYDEDPQQIIAEVEKGIFGYISQTKKILTVAKIPDRREAIKQALSTAKPDDTVAITGKGAEQWMAVSGGKKITWDDRLVVKETLGKYTPDAIDKT